MDGRLSERYHGIRITGCRHSGRPIRVDQINVKILCRKLYKQENDIFNFEI